MYHYSEPELLAILKTDPEQLVEIIKQFQKEDAEKNGKYLYFNDEELVQTEEYAESEEEYL